MFSAEEDSRGLYVLRRGALPVRWFTPEEEATITHNPYAFGLQGVYDYLAFCHARQRYGRRIRRSADGFVGLLKEDWYGKPRLVALVCSTDTPSDRKRSGST